MHKPVHFKWLLIVLVIFPIVIGGYIVHQSHSISKTIETEQSPDILFSEDEAHELALQEVLKQNPLNTSEECLSTKTLTKHYDEIEIEVRRVKSEGCGDVASLVSIVDFNVKTKQGFIEDRQSSKVETVLDYIAPPNPDTSFCKNIISETTEDQSGTYNETTFATSSSCMVDIGNNTSLVFSFINISLTDDPIYVLDIFNSESKQLQTIPLEYEWYFGADTMKIKDDINFDGYKDMLLRVFGPRSSMYTYYLFDPITKLFKPDENLTAIYTPTFDAKSKTISATADTPNYYTDAQGEQQYYTPEEQTDRYAFDGSSYNQIEQP